RTGVPPSTRPGVRRGGIPICAICKRITRKQQAGTSQARLVKARAGRASTNTPTPRRRADPFETGRGTRPEANDEGRTMDIRESDVSRFWGRVSRGGDADCWTWLGSTREGYGRFWARGPIDAHRFSYTLAAGPIPDGMQIDHTCYVRSCVNPS